MHKKSATDLAAEIRPEVELLLCCARTCMDSETADRLEALLVKDLDWAYLLQTAHRHRIVSLLYWSLKTTCPGAVPKATLDHLRAAYHSNSARNLFLAEKLLKLLNLLQANRIPAISLRGPILAAAAYGNLALRQFGDLDIMVHRQDVLKAKDLLISQGYRMLVPEIPLTDAQEAYYLKSHHEYSFVGDDGRVIVELQWRFTDRYFSFPLDPERSWEHLEPVSLAGRKALSLSPEDLLLILCMHGSGHGWGRLNWICDVAELTRVHPEMDWDQIMKQARLLGSERMLFLGLFLANDLLGAALPEKVLPGIEADPVVRSLAAQVREQLFREVHSRPGVLQPCLFHLKVRERLRDRVWYCLNLTTTLTVGDWAFLSLPAFLFFLHYLLRPIRLVGKYGLNLSKHCNSLAIRRRFS